MELNEYQKIAAKFDKVPGKAAEDDEAIFVPLLGLAGESGELLSEYKKHLRDGNAHTLHKNRVREELGDLLWYLSNVASKYDLTLEEVATANIEKCENHFGGKRHPVIDDIDEPNEQLPRVLEIELRVDNVDGVERSRLYLNGSQIGHDLKDLAYSEDGYRYHDVFHLAYAAVLGWSPVTRWMLKKKRKSKGTKDAVEDGGRAIAIEEGISALVFSYARDKNFLADVIGLDSDLLRMIKQMTKGLEVQQCTSADWEDAILQGYQVWREVCNEEGGVVTVDLTKHTISFASKK